MANINTHLGVNHNWIAYRNGHNPFTITLTESGSAYDISEYVFAIYFRTLGGTSDKLTLTEGSGITNNGATGVLNIELTEDDIASLPRDTYFYVIEYTIDEETYPLIQGNLTLSSETNPGSPGTSLSVSVSLTGTALTAAITLANQTTSAEILEMVNDAVASSEISSGLEVNVDAYGAVGDGTTDDSDAITDAITAAAINGILRLSPTKTYLLKSSVRILNGQTLIGNGATLKRGNAQTTTLAAAALDNVTSITVADASVFAIGDRIMIIDATSLYGGTGRRENSLSGTTNSIPQTITNIVGNVITLDLAINLPTNGNLDAAGQFPIGATVVKHFPIITMSSANEGVTIEGVTFDGNRANNAYSYSWVVNETMDATGRNCKITKCTFKNTPCENIIVNNYTTIADNYGHDMNGSFAHISQSAGSIVGHNMIVNNKLRNICEVDNAINEHNEGAITFSNTSQKTFILGNSLDTCGEAFVAKLTGAGSTADFDVYIRGNTVKDANGVFEAEASTEVLENIHITDNQFINCNYIYTLANSTAEYIWNGTGINNIIISDNRFTDTRIFLIHCTGIQITGNNFKFSTAALLTNKITGASQANAITLKWCANANISGNTLEDYHTTEDANLLGAISFAADEDSFITPIKTDALTSTVYSYGGRYITISNNTITGFSAGITDHIDAGNPDGTFSYLGVNINNNTIVLRTGTDAMYGIRALSGVIVNGNKIYGDSNALYGILAAGTNLANSAAVNGAIVYDNVIYGITISIRVAVSGTPTAKYNARVYNNFGTGSFTDNSGGSSTASGNVTLIAEAPTIQLLRANDDFY